MLLLVCLLFPAIVFGSDVLEFTDSNFATKVAEHPIALVEFYAPWCGHCKALAPKYEEAATALKRVDPPVALVKVDCTKETTVCSKYSVSGYPTLKIFKNGEFAMDYQGERETDGIVKYMISKAGPSSKDITTSEQMEKFLSSDDPVVVGFFESSSSTLKDNFQKAADALNEDFRFAFTTDATLISKYGEKETVTIFQPKKMKSKFEKSQQSYPKDGSDIKDWISKNIFGIAGVRTGSNAKYFTSTPIVVAFYDVDYENNQKQTNYWRNRLVKVLKGFTDSGKKLNMAISSSKSMGQELEEFGISSPDTKIVYVTLRNEKGQKFKMTEDFSVATFETFLKNFFDNKLEVYMKSEEVPASQDESVKVVVAKNFDKIVNDPKKDVLIEFYAPWCGHCKSLEPKYKELAEKLKDEPEITIAKMDATANDVPSGYEVSGFPTLYFAPKDGKKNPRPYQGGREVDDFVKYLAAESSSPLKGFGRNGKPKQTEL